MSYPAYGQGSPAGGVRNTKKIVGILSVIIGFLVVLIATVLSTPTDPTSGGGFLGGDRPVSDADVISLAIGNAAAVGTDQEFMVPLLVFNAGGKNDLDQTVSKIVVGKDFLDDGISVVSLSPVSKGQQASEEGLLFVMNDAISAFDTKEYTLTLHASKAGTYAGPVKVCFITDFCAEATLKTVVH